MSRNKQNIATIDPSFLDDILNASVSDSVKTTFKHLLSENEEKKKQNKVSGKIDKLDLRAERDDEKAQDEQEATGEEEKAVDTSSPKVKAQKLPSAMEAEDIAKMLNIIRAGKSLKDPEVKERFDIWFSALSPPEKIALKALLDGIAQIISGDIEAEEASKPSAAPYNVEMGAAPKEKPRKTFKKSGDKLPSEPAGTDAPIIVGEVSNTTGIKKRMVE